MSQENVELANRCYDAINRRDLDALLALMDDDVEAVSCLVSKRFAGRETAASTEIAYLPTGP
jgi:ketosteroid isomerase-like protein